MPALNTRMYNVKNPHCIHSSVHSAFSFLPAVIFLLSGRKQQVLFAGELGERGRERVAVKGGVSER